MAVGQKGGWLEVEVEVLLRPYGSNLPSEVLGNGKMGLSVLHLRYDDAVNVDTLHFWPGNAGIDPVFQLPNRPNGFIPYTWQTVEFKRPEPEELTFMTYNVGLLPLITDGGSGDVQDFAAIAATIGGPEVMVAVALGTSGRFESHLEVGVLNGRGYSHWLVVGDFDGDTFPDLAVTASGGIEKSELRWWRGDGTGAFSVGGSYELAGDAVDLAAGDLDGNGKAELLVAEDSDPQVTVLGLAGSSLLALGQMKQVTGPLALLGGDQLVAQDSVYRYQGGALVLVQPLPITGSIGQVEVADFDLDGISDLALAHSRWAPPLETPLEVHLGSASGEFTRSAIVRADWGFTVADVDRNGTPDLVSRTMDGRIGFYGNQGGTGFGGLEQRFPQSAPAAELRTARLGPADGDDTVVMLGTLGTLRGVGDDCFAVP